MSAPRTFTDARVAAAETDVIRRIGRDVLADARAQMFANVAGCASFVEFANERAAAAEAAARKGEDEAMSRLLATPDAALGTVADEWDLSDAGTILPRYSCTRRCPVCRLEFGPADLTWSEADERILCLTCADGEPDEDAIGPCPPFLASVIGVVFVAALLGLAGVFAAGWLLWARGAGR